MLHFLVLALSIATSATIFWVDGGESFSATTIPNVYVYVHGTKTIDYLNDRYVKMDSSLTEHPN